MDRAGKDDGDADRERDGERLGHDEYARGEGERGDAADEQPRRREESDRAFESNGVLPDDSGMRRRVKKRTAPTNDANRDGADIALRS